VFFQNSAGTEYARFDSSGNLGIGTSSPSAPATIKGRSVDGQAIRLLPPAATSTFTAIQWTDDPVTQEYSAILGDTSRNLIFRSGAIERMRIDSSGNVGIGTASPDTRLTIEGGTGAAVKIRSGGDLVLNNSDNSGEIYLYCDAASFLTVNGGLRFDSGYGSAATAYGCRAWVNFDGTTNVDGNCTIRASGNVSSITDNGTGNYTVNFATAMPDANYCVASTSQNNTASGSTAGLHVFQKYSSSGTQTTTQFQMMNKLIRADTSSAADGDNLFAAFFR
jgi:hypothetical protein